MSLTETGTLVVVTNIVAGTPAGVATFVEETAGIMPLILQVKGQPIAVSNYVHTQDDYIQAFQQAGLRLAFCEQYAPQLLRFEQAHPGITLAHVVLLGKK